MPEKLIRILVSCSEEQEATLAELIRAFCQAGLGVRDEEPRGQAVLEGVMKNDIELPPRTKWAVPGTPEVILPERSGRKPNTMPERVDQTLTGLRIEFDASMSDEDIEQSLAAFRQAAKKIIGTEPHLEEAGED